MIFYRKPDGSWHGTQADAGKDREQIDVPTDKPGLLAFLNEHLGSRSGTLSEECIQISDNVPERELVKTDEIVALNPNNSSEVTTNPQKFAVEDIILGSDPPEFARYLQCTLERLGELRSNGWSGLRPLVSDNARSRTSIERGLGYLVLELNIQQTRNIQHEKTAIGTQLQS
jgi:hypothetical protein